jgi:ABC-2 type transport system ATP-binding protein
MTANQANNGPVIEMEGVTKQFGDNIAVRDVTLDVPAATIFGVVGPSGCGKTTTIRMLTGVYRPTKGRLRVLGASPEAFERRVRERIGYMPQLFVLYPTLTIWENLNFVASLYGLTWFKRRKHLERLLEFVELTPARNSLAGDVSGGMKRRLELACSLVNDPELLFADEPTAGVDPVLRGKFWDHFRELKGRGHSLVVTTQYVSEVAYCDQVAVMRNGKLLTVDTPSGLRRRALGGEIIRLTVDAEDEINARQILQRIDFVRFFRRPDNAEQGVLDIYTDNAGRRLPDLIRSLHQDPSIDMRKAEEHLPPFDDIFVILMERAAKEDPESAEEHVIDA